GSVSTQILYSPLEHFVYENQIDSLWIKWPFRSLTQPLCQFRLKIPHCTGRKFPTPEPHEWASLASDGVEPSAVFWRALGGTESEAKERAAASAPSCPRGGGSRPALRRSFSR